MQRRIADPIGMNRAPVGLGRLGQRGRTDGQRRLGKPERAHGISAREAARFGLLFLNRGRWNGKQLVSAGWVDEATRVQVPATVPHGFLQNERRTAPANTDLTGG